MTQVAKNIWWFTAEQDCSERTKYFAQKSDLGVQSAEIPFLSD